MIQPPENKNTDLPGVVFDHDSLFERLMEDTEFVKIVVETFNTNFPEQLHLLEDAYKEGDSIKVRREAHAIKGASANAGALIINHLASKIEVMGERGELSGVSPLLSQLPEQFEKFEKEFKALYP